MSHNADLLIIIDNCFTCNKNIARGIDLKKHVITEYTINTAKPGKAFDGYTIVMLSDFHNNSYGVDVSAVMADIKRISPDIIIVAGDIYTGKKGVDNKQAEYFLKKLAAEYEVYYGIGNHEQRMQGNEKEYGDMYERFENLVNKTGIKLLLNETAEIKRADSQINITGFRIGNEFYKKFRRVPMSDNYMDSVLNKPDRNIYQILIAHTPVYFEQYAKWGADLIFSGHLHGGMAKIPGFGGIIAPNYRLFPKYDSGKYEEYGSTMILGAGIGTHTINIRPFNPAEIVKVTINTCNNN